jgi:NAD-dependent aldehyde dehydrogenases
VAEEQADTLVKNIQSHVDRIKVGDGMLEDTTMGPLASKAQFETVHHYVRQGIESGLTLVVGGQPLTDRPDVDGYYFAPTVFDQVGPDSPLADEEIFGPVLPILRVRNAEEAISVANATRYGLAASLFTSRSELISRFLAQVKVGMIHVNHGTASQAHVPFGGKKDSGVGAFSIGPTTKDFYTSTKTIYAKW